MGFGIAIFRNFGFASGARNRPWNARRELTICLRRNDNESNEPTVIGKSRVSLTKAARSK
jgi:hypothetical protein